MHDLYEHELSSYKREIEERDKILSSISNQDASFNLTHFSIGLSNRANLIVIGLCSLVEVKLYEIAEEREKQSAFKLKNLKSRGLNRSMNILIQTQAIDFQKLRSWASFHKHLYIIRNALVHGYGGVVPFSNRKKIEEATKALNIQQILCTSRIRFETVSLWKAHKIVSQVISEINEQAA